MKHLLMVLVVLVAACGAAEEEAPAEPVATPQGRPETQSIRNTQAIGYDGKVIADKVDAGIKANEEQVKKAQRESEEQPAE